ncbi:Fc.00g025770.m01.CDS01 [Cosmosporella sp. VM-42]
MLDMKTNIRVTSYLTIYEGCPFVRSNATIFSAGERDIIVTQLSSLVLGFLTRSKTWWSDYTVTAAKNSWFRDAQWKDESLPDVGIDDYGVYGWPEAHRASLASFTKSNRGTFFTQKFAYGHVEASQRQRDVALAS